MKDTKNGRTRNFGDVQIFWLGITQINTDAEYRSYPFLHNLIS